MSGPALENPPQALLDCVRLVDPLLHNSRPASEQQYGQRVQPRSIVSPIHRAHTKRLRSPFPPLAVGRPGRLTPRPTALMAAAWEPRRRVPVDEGKGAAQSGQRVRHSSQYPHGKTGSAKWHDPPRYKWALLGLPKVTEKGATLRSSHG